MKSDRCRCDVITSHRLQYDVISTSYARWVYSSSKLFHEDLSSGVFFTMRLRVQTVRFLEEKVFFLMGERRKMKIIPNPKEAD